MCLSHDNNRFDLVLIALRNDVYKINLQRGSSMFLRHTAQHYFPRAHAHVCALALPQISQQPVNISPMLE